METKHGELALLCIRWLGAWLDAWVSDSSANTAADAVLHTSEGNSIANEAIVFEWVVSSALSKSDGVMHCLC